MSVRGSLRIAVSVALLAVAPSAFALPSRTVPDTRNKTVAAAYEQLRAAGFRVSIPGGFGIETESSCARVAATSPQRGVRAPKGSTVRLRRLLGCPLGSVADPIGPEPQVVVPQTVGLSPVRAVKKINAAGLFYRVTFGPLKAARRPRLNANYVVVKQSPDAGTAWQPFLETDYALTLTPIVLTATQR